MQLVAVSYIEQVACRCSSERRGFVVLWLSPYLPAVLKFVSKTGLLRQLPKSKIHDRHVIMIEHTFIVILMKETLPSFITGNATMLRVKYDIWKSVYFDGVISSRRSTGLGGGIGYCSLTFTNCITYRHD